MYKSYKVLVSLYCDGVLALKPKEYYNIIHKASPRTVWYVLRNERAECIIILLCRVSVPYAISSEHPSLNSQSVHSNSRAKVRYLHWPATQRMRYAPLHFPPQAGQTSSGLHSNVLYDRVNIVQKFPRVCKYKF